METTFHQVLQSKFIECHERNASYSLRAFARRVGVSPSALSEIMRKKRGVSKKMAGRILARLAISAIEIQKMTRNLSGKIKGSNPVYTALDIDEYQAVNEWYHFAILSLVKTVGFESSSQHISKRLGITVHQADKAIARLLNLGLLNIRKGKLVSTGKRFTTPDGTPHAALCYGHEQNLELARTSLHGDPVSIRDFTAVTLAFNPRKLNLARKKIRRFQDELADAVEKRPQIAVYKLCIQLFPLTKGDSNGS